MIYNKSDRGKQAYFDGLQAEEVVKQHLIEQGFTILAQRRKTPHGEIDLLVSNEMYLIAIEVKQRKNLKESALALSLTQQKRLLAALDLTITQQPDWVRPNIRFDVYLLDKAMNMRHIEDAIRLF
ncbi:YraN family protein [Swingsia samuiensis]|uniref:YraN family protein n=1 Tax=Swingsia samuiensis TaxID=1293412 RepID=A0A4Y6UME7_9PROT|nr:YraN family protein [Swingsia samuiensis]QDH17848.1 YraN family protein [Swingsia samuiensis]